MPNTVSPWATSVAAKPVSRHRSLHSTAKRPQIRSKVRTLSIKFFLVGVPRIELGLHAPHACVLPLYYTPKIFDAGHACTLPGIDLCRASITKLFKSASFRFYLNPLAVSGGLISFRLRIFLTSKPHFIFLKNEFYASAPWKIVCRAITGTDIHSVNTCAGHGVF